MSTSQPSPPRITSTADLRALQEVMTAAVMRPLTPSDGMCREVQADFITPNSRLASFERLEIYARQYWFRLFDCLYDDYPALRVLLGQRRFHRLCRDYLAAHPSTSWTLRNLGSRLATFIQEPQALDVARVEWAQTLAFDEAWRKPLRIDYVLGTNPTALRLGLQPCVVLLRIDHAVDRFIIAMKKNDADVRGVASQARAEATVRADIQQRPRLLRERVHLVVHRHDNRLFFKRLEPEAFLLLAALRDGLNLAESIDIALATADPATDWPTRIREWFTEWSALGWFCKPTNRKSTSVLP